ncbi:MAG: helix-turn-helix transcriptional regulator [Cyanobacteriota bacterium]|nr:helix-turn-helix transcriptional regulator [Cyanobacteriota bacterium]MDY6359440.1 helix-turn-helix transcriptional regulator [Cyanobacteriota bacterium]MDY6364095.1 helix-turn-helix transcriptional regulator [Cyanobacteriota bacterium]
MKNDFGYILGSNIKAERLRRHYTQEKLAELLDMSINYIGKIERGTVIPSAFVIFRLSKVLRTDINDFFKEIE